jgi:hypothetical protein
MGIPRGTIRLLLDEIKRQKGSGRLLELGRMSIHATDQELAAWARLHGVALRRTVSRPRVFSVASVSTRSRLSISRIGKNPI